MTDYTLNLYAPTEETDEKKTYTCAATGCKKKLGTAEIKSATEQMAKILTSENFHAFQRFNESLCSTMAVNDLKEVRKAVPLEIEIPA